MAVEPLWLEDIMAPVRSRFLIPQEQIYEGNWHSPYFFLAFYEARPAFSEFHGIPKDALSREGLGIHVLEVHCKYILPLGAGDVALIEVTPLEITRKAMKFGYRVFKEGDPEDKLRAEGWVTTVLVDRKVKKAIEVPEWFRRHIEEILREKVI